MTNLSFSASSAQSPFDSIRNIDHNGVEFWSARGLMALLNYSSWQKFSAVIENAKENIETIGLSVIEHFLPVELKNIVYYQAIYYSRFRRRQMNKVLITVFFLFVTCIPAIAANNSDRNSPHEERPDCCIDIRGCGRRDC